MKNGAFIIEVRQLGAVAYSRDNYLLRADLLPKVTTLAKRDAFVATHPELAKKLSLPATKK
jgi:hypothetical protein